MEFYDVLAQRRSCRGYDGAKAVPEDSIRRIAEAVRLAPTACNRQPFRIVLVRNADIRAKICKVYPQSWLAEAPAIAVVQANESEAWKRLEGDSIVNVDCAIAMEHFMLAAAAEGLGCCWICAFHRDAMDRALNSSSAWKSVAISPLGFAKEGAVRPLARKEVSETFQVID